MKHLLIILLLASNALADVPTKCDTQPKPLLESCPRDTVAKFACVCLFETGECNWYSACYHAEYGQYGYLKGYGASESRKRSNMVVDVEGEKLRRKAERETNRPNTTIKPIDQYNEQDNSLDSIGSLEPIEPYKPIEPTKPIGQYNPSHLNDETNPDVIIELID